MTTATETLNARFFGRVGWLALAAVLFWGQSAVQAQSGSQVVKRLKTKYDTIKTLKADFSQEMKSAYSSGSETFAGTLFMQGPKYRVETGAQTIVTDGKTTWIYNQAEKQVLINDTVQDESSFSISDFFATFDKKYVAGKAESVRLNGEKHFKVRLTPRNKESFFQDVTFWLRDKDNLVTRLEVLDVNDTKMTFSLRNIQLNPSIAANLFTFKPPKNVEVVDLRS